MQAFTQLFGCLSLRFLLALILSFGVTTSYAITIGENSTEGDLIVESGEGIFFEEAVVIGSSESLINYGHIDFAATTSYEGETERRRRYLLDCRGTCINGLSETFTADVADIDQRALGDNELRLAKGVSVRYRNYPVVVGRGVPIEVRPVGATAS